MFVKFGLIIIVKCLNKHKDAKIQIPSDTKLQELVSSVKSQFPDPDDVLGIMDGMKNPDALQFLFFAADGTIPIYCFILPGSTHDRTATDSGFIND